MSGLWRVNLVLGVLALAAGASAPPDSPLMGLCVAVGALNLLAAVSVRRLTRDA